MSLFQIDPTNLRGNQGALFGSQTYTNILNTGQNYGTIFANGDSGDDQGYIFMTVAQDVPGVPDTTPPVITLNGANPMVLQQFATFTDPGATSDGGEVVITTGTVNSAVAATYTLTYIATDVAGNTATTTRSVEVQPEPHILTYNSSTNELYAKISDSIDQSGVYFTAYLYLDGVSPSGTNFSIQYYSSSSSPFTIITTSAGTYTLGYTVGHPAYSPVIMTGLSVNVSDTTPPVITLNGANPMVLQQFATFTDPGATSDGAEVITTSGSVNTAVAATYTLTYSATDFSGNTGTATRSVEVQPDTTAPVITLNGANPMVLQQFDTFTDPGATSDGGEVVSTSGTVNTAVAATYTLTYSATDGAGNMATATRSVEVQLGATAPVITLNGANPLVLQQFDTFTDPGATSDGGEVVSTTGTVNTSVAATYTLTYSATDGAGNTGTATRSVEVQPDTTAPVITLNGANPMVLQQFDTFTDPGATSDGGEVITTSGTVNTAVAATYTLTYSATDAAGNTGTATRSVEVQPDTTAPVITILGDNPMVLQQFDTFTDPGATMNEYGGFLTTTGTVNTAVAGTYTLTYTATDPAGNTTTATRSVEVQPDTTAPVITLIGANPLALQQNATFTDPGATSDGGEVITTSGTVNTAVAATYTLTYSATDAAGNTGTTTRSVVVQAPTFPPSGYTQFALLKQTASNWFGLGYASSLNNSTWLDGTHSWSDGAGSYHNTFSTTTTPTKILIAKPDGSWTIEVDYDDLTSNINSYYQQGPYDNPALFRKYLVPITTSGSYTDTYNPVTNTVAPTGGTTVNMSSFTKLQVFTVTSGQENNNSWTEAPIVFLNTGTIDANAPRPIYIEDQSTSSGIYTPISDIAMYVKY